MSAVMKDRVLFVDDEPNVLDGILNPLVGLSHAVIRALVL